MSHKSKERVIVVKVGISHVDANIVKLWLYVPILSDMKIGLEINLKIREH